MKCPASLSVFALLRELLFSLTQLAIVDIPEYSALSEAIVKLTGAGEGMGKIVNNPQSD